MKIIIFDVGNAACAAIISPNGYLMMIDCGSNSEKVNPVNFIKDYMSELSIKPLYYNLQYYYLSLLHITHPDEDHIRNLQSVLNELTPYLLVGNYAKDFPSHISINQDYRRIRDQQYTSPSLIDVDWGFDVNTTFQIPMSEIMNNLELSKSIKNNSSILRYITYAGKKILFCGDLEQAGFEWLANNDWNFSNYMKKGLDVLISPHHGHKSGFPKALFDLTGSVEYIIHTKGSEANIEGTDIATNYYNYTEESFYLSKNGYELYKG